ncbi:MAG: PAS domain S-box protein [Syntrophobacteraceae bacterium]|jgi:PAS domain S-box-containing protein
MTNNSLKIRGIKGISLALKIATIYFMLGVVWILLSDKILGVLVRDSTVLINVCIVKGWFYVSVTALMLYVLISRGVSQIEQSEKEARLSDAQYRELVESANSIIMRRDITGHITFFNDFAQDFFGYSKDEILGRNVLGTIVPEVDRSGRNLKKMIEDIGKHPERYTSNENENMRANGERVWIAWTNKPIRDEHGQITEILCIGNDITERKQAQEALSLRESYLTAILENQPGLVWLKDEEGRFLAVNQAFARSCGMVRPEEVLGKTDLDIWPRELAEKYRNDDKAVMTSGAPIAVEEAINDRGEMKWFETFKTPVLNEDGQVLGTCGYARDVTERKQAEEALRQSEARLKIAMDLAKLVQWEYDVKTGMFSFDDQFYSLYGTTSQHEGGPLMAAEVYASRFIPPEERHLVAEELAKATGTTDPNFTDQLEHRIVRADGEERHIIVRYGVVCDQTGRVVKTRGANQDVTERKRTEEALRESEARYRTVIENIQDIFYRTDRNGTLVMASTSAAATLGYDSVDEILGTDIASYWLYPDEREKMMWSLRKDGVVRDYEVVIKKKDGSPLVVSITSSFRKDDHGNILGVEGVIRDITDRKRAEAERLSLEVRLQRAEKMEALGTLAGGVAHDLNNVLGIVVGYSELLVNDLGESGSARSKALEIMNGGQRAAAIVQDLLTLARRGVSSRQVLNLNRIIMDCQKSPEFQNIFSYHSNVRVETDFDAELLNISGSAVHLAKSFLNLFSNAAEAMINGGTLTIKTANQYLDKPVSGYDEIRMGDYIVLIVSDTGEGISADNLKRIFEPFYTKKVMGRSGTGLGLAVVWGTVKDHNGYINVESEEGRGTTFTLYFPVTREDLSPEGVAVSASEYMGTGESILIVDDVKEQRELAGAMLKRLNYTVYSVSSGEEAVQYLRQNTVDLVVLDMIMDPGMDGLDTYAKILEIRPHQRAIIVSGFSETERVSRAQALGAGAYVKKPYILEKLGLAVRKELDRLA